MRGKGERRERERECVKRKKFENWPACGGGVHGQRLTVNGFTTGEVN